MKTRDIPGLPAYCVTEDGVVFSKSYHRTGIVKPLKKKKTPKGYDEVFIYRKSRLVHRLVAMTYLSDYANELQVNHRNGIKDDNRVSNLEMSSQSENMRHSFRTLHRNHPNKGKKLSETTKQRISMSNQGKVRTSTMLLNMTSAHGISPEKKQSIIDFIQKNPLISHRKIADFFKVSQSSVSKYAMEYRQEPGRGVKVEIFEEKGSVDS